MNLQNLLKMLNNLLTTVAEPGPPSTFAGLVKSHEELKSISRTYIC